ncbi:MutS-related protein [Ollibium composti]|uniref:DNA mismatch repair protein MutS n=1 Tax=Ollibium composti TaxID=2675109 RepID=A0ABY2Q9M4_9HYPH|nr:DNA mismatch repair protein MutS [Mesorhizobium composti]THF58563.1 DNA mismatch repair protein MutS [Mesorhizobium composti]
MDDEPGCFVDLNLDQVIASAVAKYDESRLRPFFYSTYRNEDVVRYRQEVFRDLEDPEVLGLIPTFCDGMRKVRLEFEFAGKVRYKRHRQMVLFGAIQSYCGTVRGFAGNLGDARLRSRGLRNLRGYLDSYVASLPFTALTAETDEMHEKLSAIRYSMLIHGDKVTVRKYAGEADYSAMVRSQFERFRNLDPEGKESEEKKPDTSLNHVEEGILDFIGDLYPEIFSALEAHLKRHADFIDETVALFDREIQFFLAYLHFVEPLKQAGLNFCYPEVSASDKSISVRQGFDLALAAKLAGEKKPVVGNDFLLDGPERLIVVSGPNQGGKTTFARMFGQLHFLAGLGCPVPGMEAKLFLADRVYTHFEREEDITNLRGKLEDELVHLHETVGQMTGDSIVILNEIFNSTSLQDQIFLSRQVLDGILATDAIGVCVTFIDELASLSEKTVSMVSTVVPDNPAVRTFEILRRPADGLAYALSLAEKHNVTHERLRDRIKP